MSNVTHRFSLTTLDSHRKIFEAVFYLLFCLAIRIYSMVSICFKISLAHISWYVLICPFWTLCRIFLVHFSLSSRIQTITLVARQSYDHYFSDSRQNIILAFCQIILVRCIASYSSHNFVCKGCIYNCWLRERVRRQEVGAFCQSQILLLCSCGCFCLIKTFFCFPNLFLRLALDRIRGKVLAKLPVKTKFKFGVYYY